MKAKVRQYLTRGRPKKTMNSEDRARREVANDKERQRMRAINCGIECLRQLLTDEQTFVVMSKADVLRESVRMIEQIETRIEELETENNAMKALLNTQLTAQCFAYN